MSKLTNEHGVTVTNNDDIVYECKTYYSKLYNHEPVDVSLKIYGPLHGMRALLVKVLLP